MISTEVAREARKIPETLEIRSVPCRLPFQDRLSIAVDASNPLLGPDTAPIMCQLRHIKSRWERAPRNKREIKEIRNSIETATATLGPRQQNQCSWYAE